MKALAIRNEAEVRNAMFDSNEVSLENFLAWIERLRRDAFHLEYLVFNSEDIESPLGVLCVNEINQINKTANWAIFLTQHERSKIGAALEWFLINHIFDELHLEKLNCQVLETNQGVLKLHQKFHFQEEGYLRNHVVKNGEKFGAYCLELTKEDWLAFKPNFFQEHRKLIDRFDIHLQKSNQPQNSILKKIEDARESYNLSLGVLLRLSLESRSHDKLTIDDFLKIQQKALSLEKDLLSIVEPLLKREVLPLNQ